MASFLKALANTIRGKRDEAAQKLADPVRDGKFAIEDATKQIVEFRTVLTKLVAATKRLEREAEAAKVEIKKYDRLAKAAGADDNEAAVMQAVSKIEEWEAKKDAATAQFKKNLADETKLRKQLSAAETKVSTAKSNMSTLAARKQGADIRKQLADASSKFGGGGGLSALDDLQSSVDEAEAEADAAEDLSGGGEEDLLAAYTGGGSAASSARASRYLNKK